VGRPDRRELRGQGPRRRHRDPDGRRQLRRRGPGFNVVIVKDGKIASPSRKALPGITRKTVFELADSMGIDASLRDVTSHELYDADELMAVTTAGGVTPINTLDGEPLGDGTPGPITVAIRDRFWALMDEPSPLIEAIDY
jgi:branched-chain amino acid aminotransferase